LSENKEDKLPLKLKHFWLLAVQWKAQICHFKEKLENTKKSDIRNHGWPQNWGPGAKLGVTDPGLKPPSSSSSYGVLFQSVTVSTMWRQSTRPEAFLRAEERPMFRGLRSASTERNQV